MHGLSRLHLLKILPGIPGRRPGMVCQNQAILEPDFVSKGKMTLLALRQKKPHGCGFSFQSLLAVTNAPAGEVVGRDLHCNLVPRQDADIKLSHLA